MSERKPQCPNVAIAHALLDLKPCARSIVYELLDLDAR
jgi:hypothetical protein